MFRMRLRYVVGTVSMKARSVSSVSSHFTMWLSVRPAEKKNFARLYSKAAASSWMRVEARRMLTSMGSVGRMMAACTGNPSMSLLEDPLVVRPGGELSLPARPFRDVEGGRLGRIIVMKPLLGMSRWA